MDIQCPNRSYPSFHSRIQSMWGGGVILIQISEIREGGPQFLKSVNGGKGVFNTCTLLSSRTENVMHDIFLPMRYNSFYPATEGFN